jgi:hypothetical protein
MYESIHNIMSFGLFLMCAGVLRKSPVESMILEGGKNLDIEESPVSPAKDQLTPERHRRRCYRSIHF